MIKYIGSKRTLLGEIVGVLARFPEVRRVADLFSGTARVGHALKSAGLRVDANDHNAYAFTLARCYVEADHERHHRDAERLVADLAHAPPRAGWFTATYCERARFFHPKNGERIEGIREAIAARGLEPVLESILLVSLMEAADRVDSTCGLQMAYLKAWAPRAHNELRLRVPALTPRSPHGPSRATFLDAREAAARCEADAAYLDPPYNQHSYLSNYHVWETLVRWDAPEVYGVACKRADCKTRKSDFNSRARHEAAFREVLGALRSKLIVVSFNDEGFFARAALEAMLAERGEVRVFARDFKRYVGAQIGIYNPRGERVGEVSHLRNTEFIYVLAPREGGLRLSRLDQAA